MKHKPKIMLHYILPPNTSGPNTAMTRISESWLQDTYQFCELVQKKRPGRTFNLNLLKDLMKQIKHENPDIIHVTGLQSAGFYAVLAGRLCGHKKIITTIRGSSVEAIGFNPIFKLLYKYIIENFTMYLSKKIYTVSHDMSKKFSINKKKNYYGVIHNPAPNINQQVKRNSIREELRISNEKKIVVCVSRMTYDKGISFAIEAIKGSEATNFTYLFVGDGPYNEILENDLSEEISEKKVFVLGKRIDVLDILSESDIFLFPTLHENLSNALLEACSQKLCVIATDVGGNPEVITHNESGLLVNIMNSNEIIDALNYLNKNGELIELFGQRALNVVNRKFSQEKIYSELDILYKNLLLGRI